MVEEKGAITFLMSDILGVLAAPKDLIAFNWSFKLANEEVNCCQVFGLMTLHNLIPNLASTRICC